MLRRNIAGALICVTSVISGCTVDVEDGPFTTDTLRSAPTFSDELTGSSEEALSTYTVVNASTAFFIPPLVYGDREYRGHGPVVNSEVQLVTFNQTQLWARVYMRARESESNWTEARGSKYFLLFTAGSPILRILGPTSFTHEYIDNNHEVDTFTFSTTSLVSRIDYVGDTRGDEAGTRTGVSVYFNPIPLQLQ